MALHIEATVVINVYISIEHEYILKGMYQSVHNGIWTALFIEMFNTTFIINFSRSKQFYLFKQIP